MKLAGLVCMAALAARADVADACSCAFEKNRVAHGLPSGKVPCNTHVFLRDVKAMAQIVIFDGKTKLKVPYDVVEHRTAGVYELVPKKRLTANTTYAVMEGAREVLSFTTTATNDKRAPVIEQFTGERVVNSKNSCDAGVRPYLKFQITIPSNGPPEDAPYVAVWRADAHDKVDFSRGPDLFAAIHARGQGFEFQLGLTSMCSTSYFATHGDVYGFALIDLAGNRSATTTVTVPNAPPRLIDAW